MTAVSARSFRFAYGSLLFLALTCGACGGGGGTDEPAPPPGEQPPLGITGRVYAENMDLGTLSEQEPNDARAQSHRLPPISARAYLQVRGQVDATDDPVDAFRFEVIQTQDIRLDVRWVGRGGPATVEAEVIDSRDGSQVAATTPGNSPRLVAFQAVAGVVYDVVLEAVDGRAAWEMGFAGGPSNQPLLASTTSSRPGVAIQPPVREAMACATTHVLVGLASDQAVEGLAARHGVRMGRRLAVGGVRVELPDAMSDRNEERIRAWCRELAKDDEVLWAEPDWLVKPLGLSDNAELPRQWNLHAVGAPDAWDTTRGAASVIVGVVDSGIVSHPDLEGRIAPGGYDFISDASIAGDGDGRDTDPTDTGAQELQSGRSMWHGTHVAAIVAGGAGAASGVAGVAPDARVMVLRALGRTGGLVGDVSDAILYAAGLHQTQEGLLLSTPLPIVNLSFGIAIDSRSLELACERAADAGVLLIGASGNDNGAVLYPAAYETVVAVGAVDAMLNTLGYSNFGEEVDLAAPGGDVSRDLLLDGWPDGILSCQLDDTLYPAPRSHGYLEGTSQAAPHVAGVAALLVAIDPTLDLATLKSHLFQSALDRGLPGKDDAYGWGVVQAHAAVRRLMAFRGTPLDTPTLWLPTQSVGFIGFDDRLELPLANGGGGRLSLAQPIVETDDDVSWLQAQLEEAPSTPTSPVNAKAVVITVNRALLTSPGRYSGTIRMRDDVGDLLEDIRVIAYVQDRPFAGQHLTVSTVSPTNGFSRVTDFAAATAGYRYWMPAVTSGAWKVRAGQDLDGDGTPCEVGDACGFHGGTSLENAVVVDASTGATVSDVDVYLQPPE